MNDPKLIADWRAKMVDLSEGELLQMLAEVLTVVLTDAPTGNPDDPTSVGWWAMLAALREETLARYARAPDVSTVPRGSC